MNSRIILAVLTLAVLSSCTTAYKAQTPDDVYYSPAKPQEDYVRVETQKDRQDYRPSEETYYSDDAYLRWKVRNRSRWSNFDDYSNYDLYDYRYNSGAYWNRNGFYWNNYWSWNNYYNPYCTRVIVVNPKYSPVVYNQVRNYNTGTYKSAYSNTNNTNSARSKFGSSTSSPGVYRPSGSYNNSNNNSNSSSLGSSIKKVFSNSGSSNSNNGSSDSRPNRTYTPSSSNNSSSNSSSSGSSSGSSGSGGGGVSRPSRGGL